jgi:16S rRNA A1518/A1519 N6-dimethyltransferase RsmA/KsgA/DIM1 with predicted DNA glycosylase/AP lyase activity|tara:strand:+ start:125 stop:724 length:600 start_codon:yes stop_codon:yes gene_type:complete
MFDETLLRNVVNEIKENPKHSQDLIDSFSDNQFLAKDKIISAILEYVNKQSEVIIIGSWYGSILIPKLSEHVKEISCIDLDSRVLQTSKNRLFKNLKNIEYIPGDVFELDLKRYHTTNLIINPSCEHMRPMREWLHWKKGMTFAVTSNNMYDIEGHVNCVSSIDEFKEQLPSNATILVEDEIKDTRGTRYMLVGKLTAI